MPKIYRGNKIDKRLLILYLLNFIFEQLLRNRKTEKKLDEIEICISTP